MSKTQSEKQSVYKTCAELPLKLFFDVADSGNVKLLIKSGEVETDILTDIWEDIIIEYAQLDRNMEVTNVVEKSNHSMFLAAQFIEIKAMLIYLQEIEYREDYAERLRELGYKIDEKDYINTIEKAETKSNSIITRIKIIENEIKPDKNLKKTTFDSVMAWLMTNGVVGLSEDITVARYIEVKRFVNDRNKKAA